MIEILGILSYLLIGIVVAAAFVRFMTVDPCDGVEEVLLISTMVVFWPILAIILVVIGSGYSLSFIVKFIASIGLRRSE